MTTVLYISSLDYDPTDKCMTTCATITLTHVVAGFGNLALVVS